MTEGLSTPPMDTKDEHDPLAELRRQAHLREFEFTSNVPLIGGLIAWFRNAWNSMSTKWYVRPLMAQQTAINLALVDQLASLQQKATATAVDMEAWLVAEDREQTRLTRQVAELEIRAKWQGQQGKAGKNTLVDRPLRIAFFSPLPPARSGIADYSAELLPYLARRADIVVFATGPDVEPVGGLPLKPIDEFLSCRDQFDIALYQMGNSEHHEAIYDLLIRYPGVVVLHDYALHHFVRHYTRNEGAFGGYGRELAYVLGTEGRQLAQDIRRGMVEPPLYDEPLNERLVDASLGLMVHSEYAAAGVRRHRPTVPLAVIPALIEPRPGSSLRSRLDLPNEAILFGSFGQITAEKQPVFTLQAFSRLRETQPDAHFLFAGEALSDIGDTFNGMIESLGLTGCVHHIGYVPDLDEFVNWIYTADVVVNLRQPTAGETSAVALRAMAAGRPLIVFDHGWYHEIPADIALKIPPLDGAGLTAAMARLAGSAELRQQMGRAGREYALKISHPDQVAAAYITFIRKTLEQIVFVAA